MRTQRLLRRSRRTHIALLLVSSRGSPCWLGRKRSRRRCPRASAETLVASGLSSPTAMQFAPDGRLFVAEQGGRLRVIKNGALLPTPFLTRHRQLRRRARPARRRLRSRFATNSVRLRLLHRDDAGHSQPHQPLHRQRRRRRRRQRSGHPRARQPEQRHQSQRRRARLRPRRQALRRRRRERQRRQRADRSATCSARCCASTRTDRSPTDNPFFGTAAGKNRAIWALGLRNPFTFAFHPTAPQMFINDVGQNTWEEINDGLPGANYGWPDTEGATTDPRFVSPIYAYSSSSGTPCAITGGAFYAPLTQQFPAEYQNDYFFADYCAGWIRRLDPSSGDSAVTHSLPASPLQSISKWQTTGACTTWPADRVAVVYRISYTASAPSITTHPSSQTVAPGASVTFSVRASGPPPLQLPVAAQRRQHRRRHRAGLHDSLPPRATTAHGSAPSSATPTATC